MASDGQRDEAAVIQLKGLVPVRIENIVGNEENDGINNYFLLQLSAFSSTG